MFEANFSNFRSKLCLNSLKFHIRSPNIYVEATNQVDMRAEVKMGLSSVREQNSDRRHTNLKVKQEAKNNSV